jgi:hypothetical protein
MGGAPGTGGNVPDAAVGGAGGGSDGGAACDELADGVYEFSYSSCTTQEVRGISHCFYTCFCSTGMGGKISLTRGSPELTPNGPTRTFSYEMDVGWVVSRGKLDCYPNSNLCSARVDTPVSGRDVGSFLFVGATCAPVVPDFQLITSASPDAPRCPLSFTVAGTNAWQPTGCSPVPGCDWNVESSCQVPMSP